MAEGAGAAVEKAAKDPVQAAVAVADAWIRHPRGAHPGCAGEEVAAAVGTKNTTQCSRRWKRALQPNLKKGRWSKQVTFVL